MKHFISENIPFEPVSHDPQLKKRVLAKNALPNISAISHILLRIGERASEHLHDSFYEIFYCIRGEIIFTINEKSVTLKKGSLIIVEPHEPHAIDEVVKETELLYFHVSADISDP